MIRKLNIQTTQKRFLKKCRYCNFKKRSCVSNVSSCPALHSNCFKCHKQGHFPQSVCCKAKKDSQTKKNKTTKNLVKRSPLTEEVIGMVRQRIQQLEELELNKKSIHPPKGKQENELQIIEKFLARTSASTDLPDLFLDNIVPNEYLKLKGGSRLKIFDTDDEALVKMLSLFRPLSLFGEFKEHKKCKISATSPRDSLCSFCLMRSTVLKSRIYTGRQLIKPIEIICNLPVGYNSKEPYENLNIFVENISKKYLELV